LPDNDSRTAGDGGCSKADSGVWDLERRPPFWRPGTVGSCVWLFRRSLTGGPASCSAITSGGREPKEGGSNALSNPTGTRPARTGARGAIRFSTTQLEKKSGRLTFLGRLPGAQAARNLSGAGPRRRHTLLAQMGTRGISTADIYAGRAWSIGTGSANGRRSGEGRREGGRTARSEGLTRVKDHGRPARRGLLKR